MRAQSYKRMAGKDYGINYVMSVGIGTEQNMRTAQHKFANIRFPWKSIGSTGSVSSSKRQICFSVVTNFQLTFSPFNGKLSSGHFGFLFLKLEEKYFLSKKIIL